MNKKQLEKKLQLENSEWWESCPLYRENCYLCETCRYFIVTVDVDRGTTPAFIDCKNPEEICPGTMASGFYPDPALKPPFIGVPTYEWYRPETWDDANKQTVDYIEHGGLHLRKIGKS